MLEHIEIMASFFSRGGPVLSAIFFVSLLLWTLVLKRYYFLYVIYPKHLENASKQWQQRREHSSWYALKIRDGLLADISIALKHDLIPIQTLTHILPLLGLFGTVIGMITIFEVFNVFGMGNMRGVADGISKALLPTTAGLFTSIIGIYLNIDLKKRVKKNELKAKDILSHQ